MFTVMVMSRSPSPSIPGSHANRTPTVKQPPFALLNHVPYDCEVVVFRLTVLEWGSCVGLLHREGDSERGWLAELLRVFPARFYLVRLGIGSFVITCLLSRHLAML